MEVVMSQSDAPVAEGKWVKGVSPKQPLHQAAHLILKSRLSAVWSWLPFAANKSDEDVEYVHQLRVSTRRAVEALRVFSDLVPKSDCQELRAKLREVRLAADEARNLDVLCSEFLRCADASCEDTCRQIATAITDRRTSAQQPIIAVHERLLTEKFPEQIEAILNAVKSEGDRTSKRTYGRQAPRYLKPVLKKFFKASDADLSDDEALHTLRIQTKKLRYTMELVEVAFEPCFRKKLYVQISALQDVMGAVNDHATAKTVFSNWIANTDDVQQEAFFRGILLAEMKAHEDLRQAFYVIWTPKAVKGLRRQFRDCCKLSWL
jgi:CHAD domain-containing protein